MADWRRLGAGRTRGPSTREGAAVADDDLAQCPGRLVGWSAEDGDGEWVVTIRSAEIRDRTLRMFAGAGVVAGSDPEVELAETGAKLRTMLHALGTTDAL
ncbi:MAG: isochorismate synthase [Pseudonocardiales bacterium]|nr:isochorismate synthase [Pseudonocardiales bacterium]